MRDYLNVNEKKAREYTGLREKLARQYPEDRGNHRILYNANFKYGCNPKLRKKSCHSKRDDILKIVAQQFRDCVILNLLRSNTDRK